MNSKSIGTLFLALVIGSFASAELGNKFYCEGTCVQTYFGNGVPPYETTSERSAYGRTHEGAMEKLRVSCSCTFCDSARLVDVACEEKN